MKITSLILKGQINGETESSGELNLNFEWQHSMKSTSINRSTVSKNDEFVTFPYKPEWVNVLKFKRLRGTALLHIIFQMYT